MYVIEVIPLAALPHNVPQLLSYFWNTPLEKGSVVEISIGKRKEMAAVVSSSPIEQNKSILKKSEFQLKKLSKIVSPEPKISDVQFKIALWLSRTYYAPLGLCLKTAAKSLKTKVENIQVAENKNIKSLLLIAPPGKTIKIASQYIKDAQGQALIVVPDKTILEHFTYELRPKFDNNKLILGTRKTLFSQFKNLRLIIVEDPLNEAYKSDMTPKYNTPDLAQEVARLYGARLIFISSAIGVKNYYRTKSGEYELRNEDKNSRPEIKTINMINEIRTDNPDILSKDLKESILKVLDKEKQALIFSPRKGFTSLLICQNCSLSIRCPNCSAPLKVHKSSELVLKCHRCPHIQQFPKFCPNCNSYKLKTAGPAGTQKIYDRVRDFLDRNNVKVPVLAMDLDIAKNETEESEIIEEIKKPKPSILIATQSIFSYRYQLNFALIGTINTDSLITFPDYDIEEKSFYQLKKLLDFGPEKLILQTYNPDNEVLKNFTSNNYEQFYDKDLSIRESFGYPPFSKLIKLTHRDLDQKKAFAAARTLVEKLRMALIQLKNNTIIVSDSTPGLIERERGLYNYHIILKSLNKETPRDILKFVPLGWSVDVDPKSLL